MAINGLTVISEAGNQSHITGIPKYLSRDAGFIFSFWYYSKKGRLKACHNIYQLFQRKYPHIYIHFNSEKIEILLVACLLMRFFENTNKIWEVFTFLSFREVPDFASSEDRFSNMIALIWSFALADMYKTGVYRLRHLLFNIGVYKLIICRQ